MFAIIKKNVLHVWFSEIILSFPQQKSWVEIKKLIKEAPLDDNRKREVSSALHVYFRDWLYGNLHIQLSEFSLLS